MKFDNTQKADLEIFSNPLSNRGLGHSVCSEANLTHDLTCP